MLDAEQSKGGEAAKVKAFKKKYNERVKKLQTSSGKCSAMIAKMDQATKD